MIRRRESFFLRHFLLSIALLWGLVVLGVVVATPLAVHLSLFKPDLNGHHVKAVAEILEAAAKSQAPELVISEIEHSSDASGDFFILGDDGKVIASSKGAVIDFKVDRDVLPRQPHQVHALGRAVPAPGDPALVRLNGQPARFLVFRPRPRAGPEQFMIAAILVFLTLVVLGSMGWSSYILLAKLRKHSSQAAHVMTRLQNGELGARLVVERQDEFGDMMNQFNLMADQVERLFARVREVELARIHLLQEIGHDLRTPLGSLLSLFEILRDKFDSMTDIEKKEFLVTGRREVKFTERLVDDLLFLARVEDPSCLKRDEVLDLSQLLRSEIAAKELVSGLAIEFKTPDSLTVRGDSQLLTRLFRNALNNSLSFATERISISVEPQNDKIQIHIEDDGPGFSEEALQTFGKKRPTRIFHEHQGSRISLGLGSVIMNAIARIYRGSIQPSNVVSGEKVIGGRVSISLTL